MTKKIILSPAVQQCKVCGCQKITADGLCAAITLPHTIWDSGKWCWAYSGDPLWEEIVRRQVAEYTLVVEARKK